MSRLAMLALAALSGCGGATDDDSGPGPVAGEDFEQLYRVEAHTWNEGSCGSAGPDHTFGEPYFLLKTTTSGLLGYHLCSSESDCNDFWHEELSFSTETDDGWTYADAGYDCCDNPTCLIYHVANELVFDADGGAHIERVQCLTEYPGAEDYASEDACAERIADTATCTSSLATCFDYVVIDAVPVE